ncbi:hypothetical protein [Paraburkholderia sp.]|uniref:hypothetical protein n=1 Tax=Paraburkholderia sp. TaxID=1926495 RepID=UPI002388DB88|nr:hypothetical protein [Paraburkholderia sp.]MDE1181778.1 hypothetical protein [Paraburkholderia sp.]
MIEFQHFVHCVLLLIYQVGPFDAAINLPQFSPLGARSDHLSYILLHVAAHDLTRFFARRLPKRSDPDELDRCNAART